MPKTTKGNSQEKQARKRKPAVEGDHIRQLAPTAAVKSFINEVIQTKARTSEAGQELATATKRATESGVNIPAARIASRIFAKARQDGLKGRILWEDTKYYLEEVMSLDKIAPATFFTPAESGQKRRGRKPKVRIDEPTAAAEQAGDLVLQ